VEIDHDVATVEFS